MDFAHEFEGARRGAIDNVNVMDIGAAKYEGEANVPGSMLAGAKDGDSVDVLTAVKD